MTRVRTPPPDIEADITAEQVVAYLLREGWTERGKSRGQRIFRRGQRHVERIGLTEEGRANDPGASLARTITDIARAEGRHPSAVLADIEGPVWGVGGRVCADKLTGAPWVAQTKCLMAGWPEEKRKNAMRNFLAFASELDGEDGDTAPHGADEGSAGR